MQFSNNAISVFGDPIIYKSPPGRGEGEEIKNSSWS